ncbi:hypothetical protein F4801DRAFT_601503 [Xylaria longipes]|nr:hypothetical protein F4801DRAFT_601503 [Xylaria longipes]RYC54526.1 hypothetical protein CHU98_g11683 [Xylaria longipes]
MRLIKTDKLDRLELMEVSEEFAPQYAILSHVWGREEVTFQDIQAFGRRPLSRAVSQKAKTIRAKKGFIKIQKAAALAAEHGCGFIWVDTCCIDKTSSAELSEAINSMFQWYKKASICYAYMEDVKHSGHDNESSVFHLLCQHSRWFTRGWTLQELIAPEDVMFYGEDWGYLGSKAHDEDIRVSLADITGVDVRVLEGSIQPSEMSIATRMKWASRRETSRLEDAAYCLMGLFDVNMPLLYGEGTKAFIRLQEEILRVSNDHSIFTWRMPEYDSNEALSGLLAESPQHFADVETYRPMPPLISRESTTWSMTNQGLRLSLFMLPVLGWGGSIIQDEYDAVLECTIRHGDKSYQSPAIRIRRLYGDQFARVDPQNVKRVATPSFDPSHGIGSYEIVFVKQKPVYAVPDFIVSFSNIHSSSGSQGPDHSCYVTSVWPEQYWDKETAILRTTRAHSNKITGLFRFFFPSIAATIDFAVGLVKEPGGNWAVWHLQQPSTGEPLRQTMSSVNEYLASKVLRQSVGTLNWVVHSWTEELENPWIQIRVEEIKIHGRLYHFIKASLVFELEGQSTTPKSSTPVSELSDFEKQITENEPFELQGQSTTPVSGFSDLEKQITENEPLCPLDLMEDITITNSLSYYLYLGHPTSLRKDRSKIRTTWTHYPAIYLEELEIQGVGETETELLRACKDGRDQKVLELVQHDLECTTLVCEPYSYNMPFEFNQFRPIHWAVVGGHIEVIRTLLDNGADFYSRTIQGWSSIHLAALIGRFVTMKWLIEYAIEKHASSYEDELLLDGRDNTLRENPLHLAVSHVSLAIGDELLALTEILENLGVSTFWVSANHAGETPLHRLAASSPTWSPSANASIIEKFWPLKRQLQFTGVYIDELGRTVLWHAVCTGSVPVVEYLIKDDATILSMGDKNGVTPLHVACRLGYADVAKVLLQTGANPNATTAPGLTAAHYAAIYDRPSCLKELIDYGADVHKPTENKEISFRPIHIAAANRYWELSWALLNAGVDMKWRCTHYISRCVISQGGSFSSQFQLVECNKTVSQLKDSMFDV